MRDPSLISFSVRVTSATKIKTLVKNTGSESLPVFLASVLILVIGLVNENNFSHAV